MSTMAVSADLPWQELHGNLRAFIGKRVRNDADVDDLVQRVLLQIVKGLGSLRDAERLHAWVYRTARNVIVDHYRSSTVRREVTSGAADDLEMAAVPNCRSMTRPSPCANWPRASRPCCVSCHPRIERRSSWPISRESRRRKAPSASACRCRA